MIIVQEFGIDNRFCVGESLAEIVMVSDNYIYSTRVGVINCFMRGDAGIAGDEQFDPIINDGGERLDVNTVTFLATDGDVIDNVRVEGLKCLHKQGSGCLSIYIKVTPDADAVVVMNDIQNSFNSRFDIWKWGRWSLFGVEEGAGGVGGVDPASEESLRDEGRQVEGRERRSIHVRRVKPACHALSIR